ncbi:MarR family winged helix-turn-helix transcriptional regulator [Nocardioides deserti]|uniref:MarR family winged helix-turn-helix transcriptional regulator n=1 Tax=Nocardioides deserti TaxID=1588644 RepID=UPI00198C3F10|nr:MarR family transcriptional regulator [Nocardioides deserti]GGO72516.1 transcriptional regulator [Nocardioides deserti]
MITTEVSVERDESLRLLEQEVGVLIRRVRRVIGVRARSVHPDLQPASYLMLGYLAAHGPVRASAMAEVFGIDKGAISRQVQHLMDLGLVDRSPDPDDGRATLLSASEEGVRRLEEVADLRRRYLDERLGDWSDDELADFAGTLARYNATLGVDEE